MTALLFYKNIVALDRDAHRDLKFRPIDHVRFASDATAVPIVLGEFAEVARQSPIAFLRVADGVLPIALMGFPGGKNLYIDADGRWTVPYIPAFIRRYPFVFAETGPDQLTVCVDLDFPGFGAHGEPMFTATGDPAPMTANALALLSEFQRQHGETSAFTKRLEEAGVFVDAAATVQLDDGRAVSLAGLLTVDEAKLRALPAKTQAALVASGDAGFVYAHLLSIGHLLDLLRRTPLADAPVDKAA